MDGEDCFGTTPVPWGLMLEYERTDAIVQLCRQLSFFRSDKLELIEREEFLSCSGMESEGANFLLVHGSVGNARKDAFLRILRLARLTLIQDIASQVIVSPQIGDVLPKALLQPLWETIQVKSLRRWNSLHWAVRCGLLRRIKRRRDMMQVHVDQILSMKPTEKELSSATATEKPDSLEEESFYNAFRDLLELEQEEQNAPLELYHSACSEERVHLSSVVANVPTLIVVWASWDSASVAWLREHLFNDSKTGKLKGCVALAAAFLAAMDDDPWLQCVSQFVRIPKRATVPKRRRLRRGARRSQIVLISMDREKAAALRTLNSLSAGVGGWASPEVSLMPLWGGPDGLQSELATELNVTELPFFIATEPSDSRKRKMGDGRCPRICYITSNTEGEMNSFPSTVSNTLGEARGVDINFVDWHIVDKEKRKCVASAISNFVGSSDAPLRFFARVDRSYKMIHPSMSPPLRYLKSETVSQVSMSGTVSSLHVQKLMEEMRVLAQVKNFAVDVKIMKPSSPLLIQLNPITPSRYIHGMARNVTCSECFSDILIDTEHHYRCLHCDQVEGVVCPRCFAEEKHPEHHVLLRIPTKADTTLHLLWGPSNVAPLTRFLGTLLPNIADAHVGIYCNVCSHQVRGVRWKCATCYQYDMCDRCDRKENPQMACKCAKGVSFPAECSQSPFATFAESKSHPKEHLFLCIRRGTGPDGDECLKPVMEHKLLETLLIGECADDKAG
ncbi:putative beta prime cop protein [Trypanosoma grayi]|uniref:putative beta prime cop protein n=1 Tax=Trypanosoma grayi TaxID=71804 RepID=UPI0004F49691|nr:putative beta prime cop protein [Trypanosoma grayi]KEG15412.1 putative beta prime cop protein [Trypanosoma grayi]